jgi:hypothetical protein
VGYRIAGLALRSLDFVFLAQRAPILSDHMQFFPTETSVFDRHAEKHVLVFLVVGSKSVLMEQNVFRVVRAQPCKVWELLPYGRDQAGLPLHAFVTVHLAMRIADSESARIPQMEMASRLTVAALMLDIETEWTLNALLTTSSSYRKCSKRQTLDRSAQATSLLRIEGMMRCSPIVRGSGCGSVMASVADMNLR